MGPHWVVWDPADLGLLVLTKGSLSEQLTGLGWSRGEWQRDLMERLKAEDRRL